MGKEWAVMLMGGDWGLWNKEYGLVAIYGGNAGG